MSKTEEVVKNERDEIIAQIRAEKLKAKTPLGRRLWEISEKMVASGQPLLSLEEIEREVAERRGGVG